MRKISHWLEEYDAGESVDILRDLALSHASLAGPLSAYLTSAIRRERFRELCEFEFNYEELDSRGATPEEIYHGRQAVAFFSKLEHLDIGIDKEKVAFSKFLEAEQACKVTNEIFRKHARGEFQFPPRVESWIYKAQRKIASILGPVPSYEKVGYRFGPGATTLTKKRMASLREKFAAGASCSEELVPSVHALLAELPSLSEAWCSEGAVSDEEFRFVVPVVVHDGRLDFVPKNAKTYRSTVTEPVLNGLFQLGVGDYLFDRLKRAGLNLRDQTRNQNLARIGSLDGKLATIDLSSASDMVAKELVYHLLPLDWADFLARGRSGHVTYKKLRLTLEKFSSMGNGYTFPLESLIFWALTSSVCDDFEGEVTVYGDDIICPSDAYGSVTELLIACGFVVNGKKSYHTGPFRESCGKDYYRGFDVRPYFQEKWISGLTLFTLHNFYVRRGYLCMADAVKNLIHPTNQIFGPDGYGDGHLLGDFSPVRKPRLSSRGFGGYLFDTFTIKGRRDIRPVQKGDFVLPAYSIYKRSNSDFESMLPTGPGRDAEVFRALFLKRAIGFMADSLPLHDELVEGHVVKGVTLPIDVDPSYKRVSIYVL